MITRSDWQVRNSQRRYPIDDGASVTSDAGVVLPEGFIVDANIWAPKYIYDPGYPLRFIFISSAMVSDQLVSLTLLGCVDALGASPPSFIPLGSISLVKPVDPYRNYPIEPLLDGVMGWVAFGHYVTSGESMSLLFSTPAQSMLAPKAARYYEYLPISGVSPYDSFSETTGDVRIIAEAPVTAEIKDMRLYGESVDRKMLVLGLEQTEETLAGFAGLCGKRPESGNCLKIPITSVAGVAPDCYGNINIQFDSEIIVRYFSNPLYPVPDPLPIRGGMCLDTVFSLDEACVKIRTLPDEAGLLPGAYTWQRPCDLPLPFTAVLSTPDAFKKVVILSGYVYLEDYDAVVTAGLGSSAEMSPCFQTLMLAETATVRTHKVEFGDTPKGAIVGMYVFDTINTRILVTVERGEQPVGSEAGIWTVSHFSKALNSIESIDAQGVWGDSAINSISVTAKSDRSVKIIVNGALLTSFTFATNDEYYDPTGKAGAYVGGADPLTFEARPAVIVSQYEVKDADV